VPILILSVCDPRFSKLSAFLTSLSHTSLIIRSNMLLVFPRLPAHSLPSFLPPSLSLPFLFSV
jgi:hypothetical protein